MVRSPQKERKAENKTINIEGGSGNLRYIILKVKKQIIIHECLYIYVVKGKLFVLFLELMCSLS